LKKRRSFHDDLVSNFVAFSSYSSLQLVLRNIRKSKLLISDSLFWIFFSAILVILAIFPQIAYVVSDLLGVQSPVNLVYLVIIALLIWRVFKLYLRVSSMDTKLKELTQRIALNEKATHSK
jgi:hypothetical protein